jgi:RNA polymerase sigma-70 factor, ECF subfamily
VRQNLAARKQHALNETGDLEQVLVAHRPQLFWHAFRILGNREDAEDALQDAFLSATRHFDQFEGRSKVSTWLTRVVINSALMVRRGRHGYRETSLESLLSHREDQAPLEIVDDRQPDPEQICASSEIGALITEQFNLLSPTLRSAFLLYHIGGLSCEQTGHNLGITVSAMKSRVARAKRQMASKLGHVRRKGE